MAGTGAFPLVIAAPSGAGKTSLARALVDAHDDVVFALSATTRPPRRGEKHDVDYHFVDERGFQRLVDTGALLEHAQVHGHLYGTLRRGVEQALGSNQTVVLDIDVQGARMVRASLRRAVLVFVLPPSVAEMQRRLVSRGGAEDPIELRRRMMTARAELESIREFDYVVINDDFDEAIRRFNAILAAERSRVYRWADVEAMVTTFRTDIDRFLERST